MGNGMVERVCDKCQRGNSIENRFCGHCGVNLAGHLPKLGQWGKTAVSITDRPLPAPQLKQIGQTVAVSLLALAAEAGLSWLNRRLKQQTSNVQQPIVMPKQKPESVEGVTRYTVTTISQQFVEIRRQSAPPKQRLIRRRK